MNALTLIIITLCAFALAYRYYGLFVANKVLGLDSRSTIPAPILDDHCDYHPTNRYVLFGHHFAAIAAAGPFSCLFLPAQFDYLPGALWVLIRAVLAGAAFASARYMAGDSPS